MEAERAEDPVAQLSGDRAVSDRLDHESGQDVVGVRVRPAPARREQRPVRDSDLDQLPGCPHPQRVRQHGGAKGSIVDVVVEAARVLKQLADRDRAAVRDKPRQPTAERIVQLQLSFPDQLQQHRGDERLGDAPDPEPINRRHWLPGRHTRRPGHQPNRPTTVLDQCDHARHPGPNQPVKVTLDRGRSWPRGRTPDTRPDRCNRHRDAEQQPSSAPGKEPPHELTLRTCNRMNCAYEAAAVVCSSSVSVSSRAGL